MAHLFLAPRVPQYTDPGQPGSPSGVAGSAQPGDGGVVTTPDIPKVPPPKPVFEPEPEWFGIRHEWIDANGKVWDLSDYRSGVFLTRSSGLRGLDWSAQKVYVSESPSVAGARWRGSRLQARPVMWPCLLYSDEGSQAWLDRDAEFNDGLDPMREGTWRVSTVQGGVAKARTLSLRFTPSDDNGIDYDPLMQGWMPLALNFTAYQPYWEGDWIEHIWKIGGGTNFFGPTGYGPPFYLGSDTSAGSAAITNPGDVDTHVTWVGVGPLTSLSVGIGDRVINVPFAIPAGQALYIDSRPSAQSATLYTVTDTPSTGLVYTSVIGDRTTALTGLPDWNGQLVKRKTTTALNINMASTGGYVFSALKPLYYRGMPA